MNQQDYEHLLSQLPLLSKTQAADVRRRLAFLIGDKSEGENEDWLLEGIFAVLREKGKGQMIPPNFRVKKSNSYGGYETSADKVRRTLEEAIPNLNYTEKKSLGVLVCRALYDELSTWKNPHGILYNVDFALMMQFVSSIPEALDKAFPGYLQTGMLGAIIRRRISIMTKGS